jgi:hypothetical protein
MARAAITLRADAGNQRIDAGMRDRSGARIGFEPVHFFS